jgi:hypothetical protein
LIDLLSAASLGTGFDSATLQIFDNNNLVAFQTFTDRFSAEAVFTNHAIDIQLGSDVNNLQMSLSSATQGFSFDYIVASAASLGAPAPEIGEGFVGSAVGVVTFLVLVVFLRFRQRRRSRTA